MVIHKRIQIFLHLSGGITLVLMSFVSGYIRSTQFCFGRIQWMAIVVGLVIVAFGFLNLGVISRVSANFCLVILSAAVVIAVGEVFFRAIGFNFAASEARAWREIAPYFRLPTVPQGAVFFRRAGPEKWTGQVLNTQFKQDGIIPNPYINEPTVTVEYDRRGFRNPADISNWEIAVAGDSFTELGYLPYQQLFTSLLAKMLDVSVLNLGTCYTGPLTQLCYLENYGVSAKTKHAFIVFFEGNDLNDLDSEYKALSIWKETGKRDYRVFPMQPSLMRALFLTLTRIKSYLVDSEKQNLDFVHAYFKSSGGNIPVSLGYTPPGGNQLSGETLHQLNYFFQNYSDFGNDRQITVWLAYMPCKRRVLHGKLEFTDSASEALKSWQPTDLPKVISELCDRYGVNFIDLTPALVRETERHGQLLYNSLYDTHLNEQGSLVVAQELALCILDSH